MIPLSKGSVIYKAQAGCKACEADFVEKKISP